MSGDTEGTVDLLETKIEARHFIFPDKANAMETAQGANVLRWMEHASGMSAMRLAGEEVVMVGMDGMEMSRPIPQGDIAYVDAYAFDTNTSSVRVHVRARREHRHTGEHTPAGNATFVLVAIDEDGETTPVPDLTVSTEEGERLRDEARS